MSRTARRLRRWPVAAMVAAAVIATGLAACGGQSEPPGNRIPGHHLTIYTSLPLQGYTAPVARDVLAGERMALLAVRGRVGELRIRLVVLDDATATAASWDPNQTTAAAQAAIADRTAIAYVGDFDSGASAVSIPLLNRAGIPQISPASTAVGLTTAGPGAAPGEPGKYYPSGVRTFVAVAPDDASQAAAQVSLQRGFGCTRVDVVNDETVDGYAAAASFGLVAHAAGLIVVGSQSFDPRLRDFTSLAGSLAGVAPDCVFVSAMPGPASTILVGQVAAALPHAHLFATSRLAVPAFTDPAAGGIPAAVADRVLLTVPGRAAPPAAGGPSPAMRAPLGLLGYEAMRLVLAAIRGATEGGHGTVRRSAVRSALFKARDGGGPLGPVAVRPDGTTTLRSWTVVRIAGGRFVPSTVLTGS